MRGRALLAFFYGFLAVLFTLLAVGVEQWVYYGPGNSIGLFGFVSAYVFTPFSQQGVLNNNKIQQYALAGSVGAAFTIIGAVLLTVFMIVAFMKAFKSSLPFPERKLNDQTLTIVFSRIGLYSSIFGSLSVWFGWALWASLRVYQDGTSGWSILFVVLGFVFGFIGAMIFSIEVSGEYILLPDQVDEELNRDFVTPPYKTTLRSFFFYNQWDAPALTRTLFHLSLIVFTIYYLDFTTTFDVVSPKDLWIRILVGVLYWMVAAVISRIVCELVLALFVWKDHIVGKVVRRPARQPAPVVPLMEDAPIQQQQQQPQQQAPIGGGYQAI